MLAEIKNMDGNTIETIEIKTLDDLMKVFEEYGREVILTQHAYPGWSYLYASDITIIVPVTGGRYAYKI